MIYVDAEVPQERASPSSVGEFFKEFGCNALGSPADTQVREVLIFPLPLGQEKQRFSYFQMQSAV
jgi:hypothetical protein